MSPIFIGNVDIRGDIVLSTDNIDGSPNITISAPDALMSSYTITLPMDDGTSGQVLSTDGSGVLTWEDPTAGSLSGAGSAEKVAFWQDTDELTYHTSIGLDTGGVLPLKITGVVGSGFLVQGSNGWVSLGTNISGGGALNLTTDTMTVSLNAPISGTSYTLVFPDSDGGVGEALITDGSGNLSWGTMSLPAHSANSRIWGSGSGGTTNIELIAERGLSIDTDGIGINTAGVTTDMLEAAIRRSMAHINGFRLSGVTATPVMTSDNASLNTIFLVPYKSNTIALYDGTNWNLYQPSSERSLALSGRTTDLPFDIFAYDNAGTVTLEFTNWSNATTRATPLVFQDGVLVRSGATTRRYLGTCRPRSATTFSWRVGTNDASARIDLWNADNRVEIPFFVKDTTNSWNYTTATWRQARASANNQVEVIVGLQESSILLSLQSTSSNTSANIGRVVALAYDSTSVPGGVYQASTNAANYITGISASLTHQTGIGRHYYAWLEYSVASGTCTWYGDNAGNTMQSGIHGTFHC